MNEREYLIYTHCWDCDMWLRNLPGNTRCEHCGSMDTTLYYPEEVLRACTNLIENIAEDVKYWTDMMPLKE